MVKDHIDDILQALPFAVIVVRSDEKITFANAAALALLGDGLVGRHYVSVLRQPALLDCIEGTLRRHESNEAVYLKSDPVGQGTYRARAVPVDLDPGYSAVVSFEDLSHLQQADEIRRDFVANVSHELRTPLTALLGFVETLRGAARNDPEARDRFLTTMQAEAERMNRLIGDLLSLSRVESNERIRPTEPVDIIALVKSAAHSISPLAEAESVQFEIQSKDDSIEVPGDADQLTQVFFNLFENAIKYGAKPGTVSVTIEQTDNDPRLREPAVVVTVQDQGEGIDSLHLPRLTERFYRIDSHRSRQLGGTGLGLAIAKHIVSRHRGRLRIASEPGQGSRFSVILPRR